MAFDRFVQRYASALADAAFIDELGPVPAATNAVVFDHLLARLLERNSVRPDRAIDAQVATWRFLWGDGKHPAVNDDLDDESAQVIDMVLADAGAREATVRGLAGTLEYEIDKDQAVELRDIARHLLTSTDFGLDAQLLEQTAARADAATGLLHTVAQLAAPTTPSEIIEDAAGPYGVPRNEADWHNENVRRLGRPTSLQLSLSSTASRTSMSPRPKEILERTYVASHYADHGTSYARVRFARPRCCVLGQRCAGGRDVNRR
jgi:hypothetical protein